MLKRLNREDKHHRFFAELVSEEEYPDYKTKIDAPMDLSTLQLHVDKGKYDNNNKLLGNFMLIFFGYLITVFSSMDPIMV